MAWARLILTQLSVPLLTSYLYDVVNVLARKRENLVSTGLPTTSVRRSVIREEVSCISEVLSLLLLALTTISKFIVIFCICFMIYWTFKRQIEEHRPINTSWSRRDEFDFRRMEKQSYQKRGGFFVRKTKRSRGRESGELDYDARLEMVRYSASPLALQCCGILATPRPRHSTRRAWVPRVRGLPVIRWLWLALIHFMQAWD